MATPGNGVTDEIIRAVPWPHWKEKDQKHSYNSAKALGVLWDFVEQRLIEANNTNLKHDGDSIEHQQMEPKPGTFIPENRVLAYIEDAVKCDRVPFEKLRNMKDKMRNGLKSFIQFKLAQESCGEKEISNWYDAYCSEQKASLILCRHGTDEACLAAAVLYEQAFKRVDSHYNKALAIRFAWDVGIDFLCRIIGDTVSDPKGAGKLPLPMPKEKFGALFGK